MKSEVDLKIELDYIRIFQNIKNNLDNDNTKLDLLKISLLEVIQWISINDKIIVNTEANEEIEKFDILDILELFMMSIYSKSDLFDEYEILRYSELIIDKVLNVIKNNSFKLNQKVKNRALVIFNHISLIIEELNVNNTDLTHYSIEENEFLSSSFHILDKFSNLDKETIKNINEIEGYLLFKSLNISMIKNKIKKGIENNNLLNRKGTIIDPEFSDSKMNMNNTNYNSKLSNSGNDKIIFKDDVDLPKLDRSKLKESDLKINDYFQYYFNNATNQNKKLAGKDLDKYITNIYIDIGTIVKNFYEMNPIISTNRMDVKKVSKNNEKYLIGSSVYENYVRNLNKIDVFSKDGKLNFCEEDLCTEINIIYDFEYKESHDYLYKIFRMNPSMKYTTSVLKYFFIKLQMEDEIDKTSSSKKHYFQITSYMIYSIYVYFCLYNYNHFFENKQQKIQSGKYCYKLIENINNINNNIDDAIIGKDCLEFIRFVIAIFVNIKEKIISFSSNKNNNKANIFKTAKSYLKIENEKYSQFHKSFFEDREYLFNIIDFLKSFKKSDPTFVDTLILYLDSIIDLLFQLMNYLSKNYDYDETNKQYNIENILHFVIKKANLFQR